MKKRFFPFLSCLLWLLCTGAELWAQGEEEEEVLQISCETLDPKARRSLTHIYLSKHKVLLETQDSKKPSCTLYHAENEVIYLIFHKKKEYYLIDQAGMEALKTMLATSDQQLAPLLPVLAEADHKKRQAPIAQQQLTTQTLRYEEEAGKVAVKKWQSSKWVGKSEGQLRHEVYLVSYQQLGMEKDDFQALISLHRLLWQNLQEMSLSLPGMIAFSMPDIPAAEEGLPVKSIYYDAQGKPLIATTMLAVEETRLAPEKWELPAGYQQKRLVTVAE